MFATKQSILILIMVVATQVGQAKQKVMSHEFQASNISELGTQEFSSGKDLSYINNLSIVSRDRKGKVLEKYVVHKLALVLVHKGSASFRMLSDSLGNYDLTQMHDFDSLEKGDQIILTSIKVKKGNEIYSVPGKVFTVDPAKYREWKTQVDKNPKKVRRLWLRSEKYKDAKQAKEKDTSDTAKILGVAYQHENVKVYNINTKKLYFFKGLSELDSDAVYDASKCSNQDLNDLMRFANLKGLFGTWKIYNEAGKIVYTLQIHQSKDYKTYWIANWSQN